MHNNSYLHPMELKERITEKFYRDHLDPHSDWSAIDEYIREFIKKVNDCPHIATKYCCEGHAENDEAYVYFMVDAVGWDIFWLKVMPELSFRFCTMNPDFPRDLLHQLEWNASVIHNHCGFGISIHATLDTFRWQFDEKWEVLVPWEKKKERFWRDVTEVFLKEYMAS